VARPKLSTATSEALLWTLIAALIFPAGVVGWAVGRYTGHHGGTRTVTVSAPATTAATTPAPTTTTTTKAPTVDAKAIFISAGCGACHTFKPAGTNATVGPDLDAAPEADAKKAGMALAAFVKQSIVDPNAYIAPGFQKGIMPGTFGQTLSAAKIDALVSYITGGK
jgi:cytochrome c551/c552